MSLEDAKPGQKRISANDLNAAGRNLSITNPVASNYRHGLGSASLANDFGRTFYVRITTVGDALGGRTPYEFEEVAVDHYQDDYVGGPFTYTTNIVVVEGGRLARIPENPAFCIADVALSVGDIVLCRRSLRSPYAWELLQAGEQSFLAVLIEKNYPDGPGGIIEYSWAAVTGGPPDQYSLTGAVGCPGNVPAYHERNLDVPVVGAAVGGSGSCPQPAFIHYLSVFRLRRVSGSGSGSGSGGEDYCVFSGHPWEDLFRDTGVVSGPGYAAYHRFLDQNDDTWKDGISVILIEAE
jgi:hypothetical protein